MNLLIKKTSRNANEKTVASGSATGNFLNSSQLNSSFLIKDLRSQTKQHMRNERSYCKDGPMTIHDIDDASFGSGLSQGTTNDNS